MSAETFAEAYQTAIYKAAGVAFTLSEKPTGTVLFEGRRFAIITAHNPRSERLSGEENQRRHAELERDLKKMGLEYTPSTGESPDGTWVEEGFAVFDVGLEQALELGQKYGQHAILWGEGGKVALAWCESKVQQEFYARPVMSPAETVRRFIEGVWNRQSLELADELVSSEYTVGGARLGSDGVKRAIQKWHSAFPDLQLYVEELICEGGRVAVLLRHTGTHRGIFLGLEATNRTVSWTEAAFWTVEAGQLTEARFIVDWADVRKQLSTSKQGVIE
jgi:predicted ester cyclase